MKEKRWEERELLAKSAQYQNAVIHCPPVAKASKAVLFPEYLKTLWNFHCLIHSVLKNLPANAGDTRDAGLIPRRREWQHAPVFLPWNSMDRGAWRAIVHGAAEGQTRLSEHPLLIETHKEYMDTKTKAPGMLRCFKSSLASKNHKDRWQMAGRKHHSWCGRIFQRGNAQSYGKSAAGVVVGRGRQEVSGQASRRAGSLKESTWISPGIRKRCRRRL